jgi:hypothetical protein
MMKLATKLSVLALVVGFGFSGCTTEDTGTGTNGTFNTNPYSRTKTTTPLSLTANAQGTGSIGVKYTRPTGDTGADTIFAVQNGVIVARTVVGSFTNAGVVSNLTPGVRYSMRVGTATGISMDSVEWSPAKRTDAVTIYETADNTPGHASGLQLGSGTTVSDARAISIAGTEKLLTDLVLASDPSPGVPSHLWLQSADVVGSGLGSAGRMSDFSDPVLQFPMDSIYYQAEFRNTISQSPRVNAFQIPLTSTSPVSFNVLTADNHYARVEILLQPGNKLYAGTPGQNSIQVRVNYQPALDLAYASRPHAPRMGQNTARSTFKF